MIYVIFGASGSGKTTLLNSVYENIGKSANKVIHKKGTTRNKRKYDDIEIESYPNGLPKDKFGPGKGYIYSSYGNEYGIERKQIDDAIAGEYPNFIICNDIETIKKLKADYKTKIVVVYLSFDFPEETIREIQKTRNIDDDELKLRLDKIEYLRKEFINNRSLFDEVITNNYGDNPEQKLWKQMERIISNYENLRTVPAKEILFEMIDYLEERIKQNNKTNCFEDKSRPGLIFVIMPMIPTPKAKCQALFNVFNCIKSAAKNYQVQRVDEIWGPEHILSKIFDHIEKAELIIADLSYERPNCYFELGYAIARGKKNIIIISRQKTKIHFDVQGFDYISFKDEIDLGKKLIEKLKNFENSKRNN